MAILSVAICDDDVKTLNDEKQLVNQVLPQFYEEYTVNIFDNAKAMINSDKKFHIILLDVEMSGLNGIKAAEVIHQKNRECLIFFVTNHEDYMDEALNKHAFRFWTKPINKARFIYGIKSAIAEISSQLKKIIVSACNESMEISINDIIYVFHQGRRTHIVTIHKEIETYASYKSIAQQMELQCFFETDKSSVVNMNYVFEYTKEGVTCVHNGKVYRASLSRRRYKSFDEAFKKWSGEKR